MSKYLTTVVETYRVDTEYEVETILEAAKNDPKYILVKYTSEKKEKKQKGEIVDEWFKLSLHKAFNDEREPIDSINVIYEVV